MECMRDHFQQGQLLDDRFRTISPLNHGSFGMVFLAEDLTTKQEVAIKCLTKPDAASADLPVSADEGTDELACHDLLKFHPHLVNLVHHFETKAHTYLVLEYCAQGDLYEAIRLDHGPLETEHVRRFMLQLVGAIEHMHNAGLYHRDIKPENIFLTASGDVKLGDFGLATRSLWSQEACVGSDRYMAPEQYDHSGAGYSPAKADLWSIGICLLNVLFSRNPFVTPTDSDVLFADYRRDRYSLYDIFPNMSQDTFEILSIAMALDPNKRDLHALRFAIQRAITFTTDDDSFDEFCIEQRDVVQASANREPLRTPSIQSPQMDNTTFPWAKALHASPAHAERKLSAIPDDYDEDLFPPSEKGLGLGESWYSGRYYTPSMASVLDSAFSNSLQSTVVRPTLRHNPPRPGPVPVPSSLPTHRSRPIPTMSQIFGKKDTVAKSWSEMWEEDAEETEREVALRTRREINARSFSHESQKKVPVAAGVLTETKTPSAINVRPRSRPVTKVETSPVKPNASPNENDPFTWQPRTPKKSPKQFSVDKWAELGNRRRNFAENPHTTSISMTTKKRSMTTGSKKRTVSSGQQDHLAWPRRQSRNKSRPAYLDKDWRQQKVIDSSDDEPEWVGGWQNFHL